MTVINGTTLTTFEVAADGSTVSIHVAEHDSKPGSLVLPSECIQAMIMTLPEMMRQALQRRYRDPSLRLVYPADHLHVECSTEPGKLILTLTSGNGFAVSFAVDARQIAVIANAAARADWATAPLPN